VKPTTKMEKIFHVWCNKEGLDPMAMRFYRDSKRVGGKQTVQSAKLKSGDVLDAQNFKTGGGHASMS